MNNEENMLSKNNEESMFSKNNEVFIRYIRSDQLLPVSLASLITESFDNYSTASTVAVLTHCLMQGFRFFSRMEGRSDPWSKNWWVIF